MQPYMFVSPIITHLWVFQYIPVPIIMKKHPDLDSLTPNLRNNLSSNIFLCVV